MPLRLSKPTTKQDKVAYVKRQGQTREHHCHWPGCGKQVPPAMWGCKEHWFVLPKALRDRVWATYRPGQEVNMTPSREYLAVATEVQAWIAKYFPPAVTCVACGGTGKNSKGGACHPCEMAGRVPRGGSDAATFGAPAIERARKANARTQRR